MKLKWLEMLAEIVVAIDEDKNVADRDIIALTDRGLKIVSQMKAARLDVGELQEIFVGMQVMFSNKAALIELVDMAHEEIVGLLGGDAWRVYGSDNDGWFYQESETLRKSAA